MIDPYAEREKVRAIRAAHMAATQYPDGHSNEMGLLEETAKSGGASDDDSGKGGEGKDGGTPVSLEQAREDYKDLTGADASPKWSVAQIANATEKWKAANPPAA